MKLLPVIDMMAGQVVRGVAGNRAEYQPVVSNLTPSTEPLEVARALRNRFGSNRLYLADLDAIAGKTLSSLAYAELLDDGFTLWVDAGVGNNLDQLFQSGVHNLVLGLESLSGPEELRDSLRKFTPPPLVFSLDLKAGVPLGNRDAWNQATPIELASLAVAMGVEQILVLDLAQVGVGAGLSTLPLIREIRSRHPHVTLYAGGGVRGPEDLLQMRSAGVDFALVASALHDGRLTVEACQGIIEGT